MNETAPTSEEQGYTLDFREMERRLFWRNLPFAILLTVLLCSAILIPMTLLPFLLLHTPAGVAVLVLFTFFLLLGFGLVRVSRLWLDRYRRSGNLTELFHPLIYTEGYLSGAYISFMYLYFWGFWTGITVWGLIITFLVSVPILLSLPGLLILAHIRGHRMTINDGGIVPRYLKLAARDSDEFLDGYSSRPMETGVSLGRTGRIPDFARFLMFSVVILDYKLEKDGSMRLFLYPGPISRLSFIYAIRNREKNCSWALLPPDGGDIQLRLDEEDYQLLGLPLSYHLLGQKIAERLRESYRLFVLGDEKGALEVFNVCELEPEKGGKN